MYESCLEEVFKAIKKRRSGQVSVMIASHNEDTVRYALKKLVVSISLVYLMSYFITLLTKTFLLFYFFPF